MRTLRTKTMAGLLALLLLAGCGAGTTAADTRPTAETTAETAIEPTTEPAAAGFSKVGTLLQYPNTCGGYWGWNTGEGYYEIACIDKNDYISTGLLLKTDYATGRQTPLCNVPGCTHDSTACPAYLEDTSRVYLLVLDGTVYVYYAGQDYWNYSSADQSPEEQEEQWRSDYEVFSIGGFDSVEDYLAFCRQNYERSRSPSYIEALNADLTARTRMLTFTDDMRWLAELYLGYCDENALYAADGSTQQNTPGRIVRLDIHTGETQEIPLYANEDVVDARGSRFLTQRIVSDAPMPSADEGDIYTAALQNARYEFDWLDPHTLEREKICDVPTDTYFLQEYKGRIYCQDNIREINDWSSQWSLCWYDTANTRNELTADMPVNMGMSTTDSGFMPAFGTGERTWVWMQKMGSSVWEDVDYLYNLDTGECVEMTQKQYRDGGTMGVSLMAQTDDGRWLVGYKPHSNIHNGRCDYGLIDPQDFLAGSENYTFVQMWD